MADSGTSSNVYLGMGNGEWECVKQVGHACIFCAVINSACTCNWLLKSCIRFLAVREQGREEKKSIASPTGNRTRVFRVTGGDTYHYTIEDWLCKLVINMPTHTRGSHSSSYAS